MLTTRPARTAVLLALILVASVVLRAQGPAPLQTPGPAAPVQPLPYSHRTHVALGMQCRGCHVNPDAGKLMTYPPTGLCMGCHQTIATDRAPIQKLTALAASGKPIPWERVYKLPDYVYWKHGTHLEAEVACVECHGPVAEREVIRQETNIVTMAGCLSCHNKRQVYTDCGDCHAPRQLAAARRFEWTLTAPRAMAGAAEGTSGTHSVRD